MTIPERTAPGSCATCVTAASARCDLARTPDDCPTRGQAELTHDPGAYLGHDLILQEECLAPVTTLVVKDRALDHHPIAALRNQGVDQGASQTLGAVS